MGLRGQNPDSSGNPEKGKGREMPIPVVDQRHRAPRRLCYLLAPTLNPALPKWAIARWCRCPVLDDAKRCSREWLGAWLVCDCSQGSLHGCAPGGQAEHVVGHQDDGCDAVALVGGDVW